jgi:hypothetical protein
MSHIYTTATPQPKRFTNFADLDLFVHRRYVDDHGIERTLLEVGAVRRMKNLFDRLEHQLRRVAASDGAPWHQHKRGICMTLEGQFLWVVLRDVAAEAPDDLCAGRRLNPWLEVGLSMARKWASTLRAYAITNPNVLDMQEEVPRSLMRRIFRVIRRICRSKKFRNRVNNSTRNAKERYLGCANLMIDLLSENARLLILRIDLYFEGDAKVLSESEEAEQAYDKFLRTLREDRIVPNLLGYIAKREDGLERRIHYHILVAMDGDLHQQARPWIERMGNFWVKQCVGADSLASFFNCWKRRDEYEYNCIGVVHYTDGHMLRGLRDAMEYLCKEGPHILVKEGKGHNLRKSQSPKGLDGKTRRGVPRKKDPELSGARQVLLTPGAPPTSDRRTRAAMRPVQLN